MIGTALKDIKASERTSFKSTPTVDYFFKQGGEIIVAPTLDNAETLSD